MERSDTIKEKGGIKMLSERERILLIRLYEETKDANLTARVFGVNRSTVYARVSEYRKTGSVEVKTYMRGRKRKLTKEDDIKIKSLIEENNDITTEEINNNIETQVCDETVRKRAIELGFRYKKKTVYAAERDRLRCKEEKRKMDKGNKEI